MKKLKLRLTGLLFTSLAVVIAVNINLQYGTTENNKDFILNNVEALAQGEGGGEGCMGSGSILCDGTYHKVKYTY